MKNKKRFSKVLAIVCMFVLTICSLSSTCVTACERKNQEPITLNVAVYQYVPDVKKFEDVIETEWNKVHKEVKLNFVSWDCYQSDPADDLDVFVFDSIFLNHFIDAGYLAPFKKSEIKKAKDIIQFALDGCKAGKSYYGIPQILCTNLLFYRKGDAALENVNNIYDLYDVLGNRTSTGVKPGVNEGLLTDLSGGTTQVCTYLDALSDVNSTYTTYDTLPDLTALNSDAANSIKLLQAMGGIEQTSYWPEDNDSYVRGKWFKEGNGRAMIAYTETMNRMSDSLDQIGFKTISLSKTTNIPLFYGDLVGVNAKVSDKKELKLAKELANLMASKEVVANCIAPTKEGEAPQYLLPARTSNYTALGKQYPVYKELHKIASSPENCLYKTGKDIRSWLKEAKKVIPIWE